MKWHRDPRRKLARASLRMNLERPDSAPPRRLNEVLRKTVQGVDSPMPVPRYTVVATQAPPVPQSRGARGGR